MNLYCFKVLVCDDLLHSMENGSTRSSHLRVYLNVKHQPYCSVKILPQSEMRQKSDKYLTDTGQLRFCHHHFSGLRDQPQAGVCVCAVCGLCGVCSVCFVICVMCV